MKDGATIMPLTSMTSRACPKDPIATTTPASMATSPSIEFAGEHIQHAPTHQCRCRFVFALGNGQTPSPLPEPHEVLRLRFRVRVRFGHRGHLLLPWALLTELRLDFDQYGLE